jgi:uncharacterized protein
VPLKAIRQWLCHPGLVTFFAFPATACWRHQEARSGFEVACFAAEAGGWRLDGTTTAVEDGQAWIVTYSIGVDAAWLTREARVTARAASGRHQVELASDGAGHWLVDGCPAARLDGCLDIDLESSALTNTLPVHRLELAPGTGAKPPAVYVRAPDLRTERLEQVYARLPDEAGQHRYRYAAPAFGFTCTLGYDESGLILGYPGIAVRAD